MSNTKKSFTLIELLVVIAIIGILSSLVIARFSNWSDEARIANTLQWSAGVHRTLGANLVGHWPLNGDTNDISGYGNHGEIVGDPTWVDGVSGIDGYALDFNGDDYVKFNQDQDEVTDNFTMVMWVIPQTTHEIDTEATSGTAGTSGQKYTLWPPHGESVWGSVNHAGAGISVGTNGISIYEHTPSYMPPLLVYSNTINGWAHVVVVYIEKQPRLYVNGVLARTGLISTRIVHPGIAITQYSSQVGGIGGGVYGYFNGQIDDVRIYDTALTAEEVGRIYAETKDKYLVYE